MTKLTDRQLIVLSNAAARDDGAAVAPAKMSGAAATKVGASLVARKLMREAKAKPGMPVWREGADGKRINLIITRAGREAIGVDDGGEEERAATNNRDAMTSTDRGEARVAPRTGSKQALVVEMLSQPQGAKLSALVEATGWLPHSARAVLTGLRKRGYVLGRSQQEGEGSVYRITSGPAPGQS
jgi:hypothetical protein